MKKIILTICFCFLLYSFAYAEKSCPIEFCERIANTAETIMKGRQAGIPMNEFMMAIKDQEGASIFNNIIVLAYEQPRFNVERNQKRAIEDFKNEVFLTCYQARTE